MAEQEGSTERTSVRTYVPAYQRDLWDDHAEELDMSRSEYVRTMVQAGRRAFNEDETTGDDAQRERTEPAESDGESEQFADAAGSEDLEEQVVDALDTDEYLSWDELLAAVTDDIEDRLEATLQDLQAERRIRYSGRNGGYLLDE